MKQAISPPRGRAPHRAAGAAGRAAAGGAAGAGAGEWPDKPVKIILPFGAGGVADVTSRILADKLDKKLGQRFVDRKHARARAASMPRARWSTRRARRLHARPRHQRHRDQRRRLQASAVRPGQTIRDDLRARPVQSLVRGRRQVALQDVGRFHRGGQGATGQAQYRHRRGRLHAESRRRTVQVDDRPQYRHRAVQALARHRGGAVAQRRADADRVPAGDQRPGRCRQAARAGKLRRQARRPRCRTCRRSRRRASKATRSTSWNGVFAPKGTPKEVVETMGKAMHEVLADAGGEGAIRQARRGSASELAGAN